MFACIEFPRGVSAKQGEPGNAAPAVAQRQPSLSARFNPKVTSGRHFKASAVMNVALSADKRSSTNASL
ncbi:hypothetical protein PSEUDO9AG_60125 [Pseudomonas sp. 9Ag]|nr:hypothetical protein PSEUDO9AG_60125 [Pseudomonas sp. 9Ag]